MSIMRNLMAAAAVLVLSAGMAAAAEIKVVTVGALRVVLTNLAEDYKNATGNTIAYTFTNPAMLAQTLEAGTFDVIIAPHPPVDELRVANKIELASYRPYFSKTGIGIAIRDGAPKPDLSTPDAFRRYVLAAKNVLYTDPSTPNGSGVLTQAILREAGLYDAVMAKGRQTNLAGGKELLAKGEFEMAFFNLSETEAPGVVVAGPVPAQWQRYTQYDAAIFTTSAQKQAGNAFITFIARPQAEPRWKAGWMELDLQTCGPACGAAPRN